MNILGLPDSLFGISVSSPGDINGDGGGDLILGALANAFYGGGYVLYGKSPGSNLIGQADLDCDGNAGIEIALLGVPGLTQADFGL